MQLRVNKNFFHQSIFYLSNIVQQCRGNIGREIIGLLPSTYRPTTGSGHAEGRPTQCGQSYFTAPTVPRLSLLVGMSSADDRLKMECFINKALYQQSLVYVHANL